MKKNIDFVWEDSKQKPGVLIQFLIFIPFLIFIIGFIMSFGHRESIGWLFLSIIFALTFSLGFRIKYASINAEGIWSGNNTSGQMLSKLFVLKQKNTFIKWNEIDKLEIDKLKIYFSHVAHIADFLIIKTKDKRKYECLILGIDGFKKALKKLNKSHLLKTK